MLLLSFWLLPHTVAIYRSHMYMWQNLWTQFSESLFIEFHYKGSAYNVCGVYRHPNGKVPHFITDLETVLNKIDNGKTTVLAGDINIDIIKFSNEDVVSYMTTLMSYRFLPYVTLPSRITNLSMTCIDHIFIRLSHKDKAVNMISGLFTVALVTNCHVSFLLSTIGNAMLGRASH